MDRADETSPFDASAVSGTGNRKDPGHIGPYRILKKIAQGGMGVVYLAQREGAAPARPVALKVVRRGSAVEDVLVRFGRERAVLAALDHPNIARLLDAGESEAGEPFFVMEFVDGQPLDDWCDARRLTVPQRVELFRIVCDAVHHAHRNLVVHRDLKPRNVLVTGEGVPKLLDFGIAKLLNPALAPGTDAPTAAGMQLMTPEYAAPEQVRGEPISTAADVYSLGVVLFELLSGRRPYRFVTRDPAEIERVVTNAQPPRPSAVVAAPIGDSQTLAGPLRGDATVSMDDLAARRGTSAARLHRQLAGDLDQITLMALRKEPQRRYASAEALAQDLRRHLERHPVIARPDSVLYRTSRYVARHTGLVIAAALLALALAGGIVATAWKAHEAERERDTANELRGQAEARLTEIRTLVRSLVFDYHDAIRQLGGATDVRRKIVETALAHLDRLRAEAGGDPTLLLEVAEGELRLASVQGGRRAGNLGDPDSALATLERVFALLEEARRLGGDPAVIDRIAWTALVYRADNHRVKGDFSAALAQAQEALRLAESAVARGADGSQRQLAVTLSTTGDLLEKAMRPAESAKAHERSLGIRRELLDANPADATARRDLTVALGRAAKIERANGHPERAVEYYREMLSIRERLLAEAGTNRARRDVMRAQSMLAQSLMASQRTQEAIELARAALPAAERLARDDTLDDRSKTDVRLTQYEVAELLARAGEREEAIALLRVTIEETSRLLQQGGAQSVRADILSGAREVLADLLASDKETRAEAVELYKMTLALLAAPKPAGAVKAAGPPGPAAEGEDDDAGAPDTSSLRRARLRISLASLLIDMGSATEPDELLDRAKVDLDQLPESIRSGDGSLSERGRLALARAEWLVKRGDFDAALGTIRQGIEDVSGGANVPAAEVPAERAMIRARLETLAADVSSRQP